MAAPDFGGPPHRPEQFVPLPPPIQLPFPPRAPSPIYHHAYPGNREEPEIEIVPPQRPAPEIHQGFGMPDGNHRRALSQHGREDRERLERESNRRRRAEQVAREEQERLEREADRRRKADQGAREERERRRNAEQTAERERRAAEKERKRRHEVEELTEQIGRVYINEQRARVSAEEEARRLRSANEEAEERVRRAEREARVAERERAVLERERQHELENQRVAEREAMLRRPRPVNTFDDTLLTRRDRGTEVIRQAQKDAVRRRERMRDDDSYYGHDRDRHRQRHERRGSRNIFDDDHNRSGHRYR